MLAAKSGSLDKWSWGWVVKKEETESSGLGWFLEFGVSGRWWMVSRIREGSEKGRIGVRIPGSSKAGMRAGLKHQVQGNGWRLRTGSEEWLEKGETKSFSKTKAGTDETEDGGYFGTSQHSP